MINPIWGKALNEKENLGSLFYLRFCHAYRNV